MCLASYTRILIYGIWILGHCYCRGSVTGLCSTVGRVGGIYALCLDGLRTYWQPLPFILIGAQAVVAGVVALGLPETVGYVIILYKKEKDVKDEMKYCTYCKLNYCSRLKMIVTKMDS